MEVIQHKNVLHVYPIKSNEYIGAIDVESSIYYFSTISTVILLDASGTMGTVTDRFMKEILPLAMSKLKYPEFSTIDLISFDTEAMHKELRIRELIDSDIASKGCGGMRMGSAIASLRSCLGKKPKFEPIRILTITSDGQIDDPDDAESVTEQLVESLAESNAPINSQVVRLVTTSNRESDTKALFNLLQLNNVTAAKICDIYATASNETIADLIVALYESDNFSKYQNLFFEKPIALKYPWNSFLSERPNVVDGWNVLWLNAVPTGAVINGSEPIKVIVEGKLSPATFQRLVDTKMPYIVGQVKVLMSLGTTAANRLLDQIVSYFQNQEDALALKCATPNNKVITNVLEGVKREEEERIRREQLERSERQEVERIKREEEERRRREYEELEKIGRSPLPNNASNSVQTVLILDEQSSGTEKRRFTENIIPLILSKLFYENFQPVQLVAFDRSVMDVRQLLQSLVQTLDARKRIRILFLTNGDVLERQEIENVAETLNNFLCRARYSFDLQVVRLISKKVTAATTTKRYNLIDINANESSELIATKIGLNERLNDLGNSDIQNRTEKAVTVRNYFSLHFIIFAVIFAMIIVRFIF